MFTSRSTLLLQVAHPVVGAGVADHSEFLGDRWGRLTGRHLPDGPAAFRAYFDGMDQDRLERNATVELLMRLDREPLPPPPSWPLRRAARPHRGPGPAAPLPRRRPRRPLGRAGARRLESAAR